MANILIVHQNFPGQFPHIADALIKRGDKVAAIGGKTAKGRPGVDLRRWTNERGTTNGIFDIATRAEADMIRGVAAASAALQLKRDGFEPDVIIAHPGWGESLFLKEVWPVARVINFGEVLYRSHGGDMNFDAENGAENLGLNIRSHAKNATQVLAASYADAIVSPTRFQANSYPNSLKESIRVIHEGVDVEHARKRSGARVKLPDSSWLDETAPVVTFVNRVLEPLRGFRTFMRALPDFLSECPAAQVIVVGDSSLQGYGAPSPNGRDWKSVMLQELDGRLDLSRVHFLGRVSHSVLVDIFSISSAHVYYTYPFVLSWSLLEAMAAGCIIIASDTTPLHDAVADGKDGILLPFFDVERLSRTLSDVIQHPSNYAHLRSAAREKVLGAFDRKAGTEAWLALVDELVNSVALRPATI